MEFTITIAIIVITCLISFTAFNNEKITNDLIFWPPMIKNRNQYYRFVTSGFIHADVMHLAFNMITLYFFGRVMEEFFILKVGKLGFVLFYIAGIIVSEVPSYIKHRDNYHYRSLGASGAVTSVLFSFILLAPWATLSIFFIPMPAIVFAVVYLAYTAYMNQRGGDYINHSAHLWGAIWGILFTFFMEPKVLPNFIEKLMQPSFNP